MKKKILLLFGTRPELIKVFPVIHNFTQHGLRDQLIVVNSGQHVDLIAGDSKNFNIVPDYTLQSMRNGQSLQSLTAVLLTETEQLLAELKNKEIPVAAIVAQGDTNTALAAALSAFYHKIPFLHIEAGLRTNDLASPFPEEFNRRVAGITASFHYVPTETAQHNLLKEGISESRMLLTGNTIVDALLMAPPSQLNISGLVPESFLKNKSLVLITCHRRENQEENNVILQRSIQQLAAQEQEIFFLWINHPASPATVSGREYPSNFKIIDPVGYSEMIAFYKHTLLIITDSGGIQEEAGNIGIPVLVMRNKTERDELVKSGIGKITDFSFENIREHFRQFTTTKVITATTAFGDGKASERIVDHIFANYLNS